MHITTRKLAAAAVTGAAYAALTMLLAPISYGAIQCRVSEVLCILPFFIPCTAWGLFAGCAIANLLSAAGIFEGDGTPQSDIIAQAHQLTGHFHAAGKAVHDPLNRMLTQQF